MKLFPSMVAIFICISTSMVNAQTEIDTLKSEITKLNSQLFEYNSNINKLLRRTQVGVSLGVRRYPFLSNKNRVFSEGSISPKDTSLQIDYTDQMALLLSAVIVYYPFRLKKYRTFKWTKNIGFVGNLNLAQLNNSTDPSGLFNKKIEGGFGLSYELDNNFSIGLTFEYVFRRNLRDYIINGYDDAQEKSVPYKVYQNGEIVMELDKNDNNLFKDANYFAGSLKLIWVIRR